MSTAKFDKEGRRRVCEDHVIKVMPGQEHVIVNRGECHECSSARSKRSHGKRKEVKMRHIHKNINILKSNLSTWGYPDE